MSGKFGLSGWDLPSQEHQPALLHGSSVLEVRTEATKPLDTSAENSHIINATIFYGSKSKGQPISRGWENIVPF